MGPSGRALLGRTPLGPGPTLAVGMAVVLAFSGAIVVSSPQVRQEVRVAPGPGVVPSAGPAGAPRCWQELIFVSPDTQYGQAAPPPKSTLDQVENTTVLFNGTEVPGNFPSVYGLSPEDVAQDAANGNIYVSQDGLPLVSNIFNSRTSLVSVISPAAGEVVGSVTVGTYPLGLAVDRANGDVYVADWASNNVTVIDGSTNRAVDSIPNVGAPASVAVDSTNDTVFVGGDGGNVFVINATSATVVKSIPVGPLPVGMALDGSNGDLYVTSANTSYVSVISALTKTVVGSIEVGSGTDSAAVDYANGDVYVSETTMGMVSVINATTNAVVRTIAVGLDPSVVAVDASNGYVYVTNGGSNNTTVIDGRTNSPIGTIPLGNEPEGVVVDSANGQIYAANRLSDNLTVVNGTTDKAVGSIQLGAEPHGAAADAANGNIYLTDTLADVVRVVNGTTGALVGSIPVGRGPVGLAVDATNGDIYVADFFTDNVSVIGGATDTLLASIPVGTYPWGVAVDPADGDVYVTNLFSNNVSVINATTNRVVESIPVGYCPAGVAVDPDNGYVYVATPSGWLGGGNLTVIDGVTNTVVGNIPVGADPEAVAVDAATGYVYVADNDSNNVSVINGVTDTVVGSLSVGAGPKGVSVDEATGDVYVTNSESDNVTLISGATGTVVGSIPVGAWPIGVTVAGSNGYVYVANYGSGSVSLLAPTRAAPLTFMEAGLPPGTNWSVSIQSIGTHASNTDTITFDIPNGSYTFGVNGVSGYNSTPYISTVNVSGIPVTVPITFTLDRYQVVFSETGLPTGDQWTVVLNGSVAHTTNRTVAFVEPMGRYAYLVSGPAGERVTGLATSGTLSVSGFVAESLGFQKGRTFTIGFHQWGLPVGQPWSVSLDGWSTTASSTVIKFANLTPAPYGYAVARMIGQSISAKIGGTSVPLTGSLDVVSKGVTVALRYAYPYATTFTETGLTSGTWSITIKGHTETALWNRTIEFNLTNASYAYKIGVETGYTRTGSPRPVIVNGGPTSATVTFKVKT